MTGGWYTRTKVLLQRPPTDAYLVVGFLLVARVAPTLVPGSLVRSAVVLPLVFFLPGYTLTTVAFPRGHTTATVDGQQRLQLTLAERLALSFGLSIGLTSLLAIALTQLQPGFSVTLAIDGLSALVLVLALAGVARRLSIPRHSRFTLSVGSWATGALRTVGAVPKTNALLSLALVGSAVLTFGTLGFVVTQPQSGSAYTGFQLVTENATGATVAADYPSTLQSGETADLTYLVRNEEGEPVTYTVLVLHQELSADGEVIEVSELERFSRQVAAGDTWKQSHAVTPPVGSQAQSRLTYLLYEGDPPDSPSTGNAYRHLFLWLDEGADTDATQESGGSGDT